MRKLLTAALVLALGVAAGALLGACGSQTKTVSVAGAPPATSTQTSTISTATAPAKTHTSPARTTPSSTTRTATAPAFAPSESGSEAASAAAATVKSHGYTPNDTSEYHAHQTLRVLVGTRTGSGDGYGQQAFFFVDGRYIGTDTREPSAKLKVVSQTDTQVTIAYPLYRHGDPLCCPGGGQANVRFELNNGKLAPVGTIPPVSSTSGLSRG